MATPPEIRIDATFEYEQLGVRWRFQASSVGTEESTVVWRDLYLHDPDSGEWYLEGIITPLSDELGPVAADAEQALQHYLELAEGKLTDAERRQLEQTAVILASERATAGSD